MTKANFTAYNTRQGYVLQSYQTFMAMVTSDGRTIINGQRYSVTTSKHVNQFLYNYQGSREAAEVVSPSLMEMVAFAAITNQPIESAFAQKG